MSEDEVRKLQAALPELTLADRCDRCHIAAAQVAVRLRESGRRLLLCGHDWQRARGALEPLTDAVRFAVGATHEGERPCLTSAA